MPHAWAEGHTRLALVLSLACLGLWLVLPAAGLGWQLVLVAVLVAGLGLPHGAVDHLQAREILAPRWGASWPVIFGIGYTLAALAVVAAWAAWPPLLLTGFLVLAIGHFGTEDTGTLAIGTRTSHPLGMVEAALRGALPVMLPILFHPVETGMLFAALLPDTPASTVVAVLRAFAPVMPVYLALLVGLAAVGLWRGRIAPAVELAVLVATFRLMPPLPSFAVYFCLWHSPRHSLTVIADSDDTDLWSGIRRFARSAVPLTLLTVLAGATAWALLRPGAGATVASLQVVFIGLAALTVPHVGLAALRHAAHRPHLRRY